MRKPFIQLMVMFLCVSVLVFTVPVRTSGSGSSLLVNGDFEIGTLNGWEVGGVCTTNNIIVHSGSYSAYISDETYDDLITQNLVLSANHEYDLEAWIYPLKVGNLGDAYAASSYIRLWFYNASSMSPAFDVLYLWCWNSASYSGNWSNGVQFLLPFAASAWNLLSRNVTQDVRSYFAGIDLSKYVLYNIMVVYHYSNGDPGAFYADDLKITVLSEPKTWVVDDDGPADFHTIQEAINAASEGDTVFVKDGSYPENVIVNKTLSLVGEDAENTIIDGGGVGDVVLIVVDGVNVTGFTARNSGYWRMGISLEDTRYSSIIGNKIADNGYGIDLHYSSNNTISGNNITSNECGVCLSSSSNWNTVSGNNIIDNDCGVLFVSSSNNIVSDSSLTHNNFGFLLNSSPDNIITGNNIAANGNGIGFKLGSDYNIISGNNIASNNGYGVYIDSSSNATFSENNVTDNGCGVVCYYSDNVFFHNNFTGNTQQVYISPYHNTWDDGYPSGGNYWSDYAGIDANHDGIGDAPYVIEASNVDNYPLMKPFGIAYHDLAVTNAVSSKTIVKQGNAVQVNVTVENHGDFAEVFNLTLYVNATQIASQEVALTRGGSASIAFEWNTSSFARGKYALSAVADALQGETNTTDNVFTDGVVLITAKWDVNADGKIDVKDVAMVSAAFGSYPGHPKWNTAADINNDLKIDVIDIAMVARHFGESYL